MDVDPSTSKSVRNGNGSTGGGVIDSVAKNSIDLYLITDEDAHYEQEILRDPYSSTKPWLRYIDHKLKTGSIIEQVFVFERACKALPRSYKIWKMVFDPPPNLSPSQISDHDADIGALSISISGLSTFRR